MDIDNFIPHNREEALLANMLGQVNELGNPGNRIEALLMKLLGKDIEIDAPHNRIEVLLWALIDMGFGISTWDTVQRLIKLGLHSTVFSIGDQLICYRMTGATVSIGSSTGVTAGTAASRRRAAETAGVQYCMAISPGAILASSPYRNGIVFR